MSSSHRNNKAKTKINTCNVLEHFQPRALGGEGEDGRRSKARGWEAGAVGGPWINGGTVGRGVGPDRVDL